MPRIEIRIIIGYSNLFIFFAVIKFLEEFNTKRLEINIKILKKLENESLVKLSRNIFSETLDELTIIPAVTNNVIVDKLNTKLKLFFVKTPIINIKNIDNVKKNSGRSIFKLLIIFYQFKTV